MAKRKARPKKKIDVKGMPPGEIRWLLETRLRREGRFDLADVLAKCATPITLKCMCCDRGFVTDQGCGKRWCPVCAPKITAKRYRRAARIVSRFQWPLSVTLTMRNVEEGEACVELMKEAFRKFRRTDFWADRVKGGIAGFEITHRGRGFHPHLHAVVDCKWLAVETPCPKKTMSAKQKASLCTRAQNELAEVWGAYVQGEKASVWVNRKLGNALVETLKYSIKPSDLLNVQCLASDIIDEIDRGRMMTSFGHAHACSKEFVGLDDPEPRSTTCDECGGINTMLPEQVLKRYRAHPEQASANYKLRTGWKPPKPRRKSVGELMTKKEFFMAEQHVRDIIAMQGAEVYEDVPW